jgi:hypothetical protein
MAFNLLADYGIDENDIPTDVGRKSIPDGTYPFTITDFSVKPGTDSKPDTEWIILDHDLGEDGQFREWFTTNDEGDRYSDKVKNSLSFLRKRIAYFGQTLSSIDFESVIGRTGTLTLATRGKFQNVTDYSIDEGDEGPAEEDAAPARPAVSRPAAGKAAGASPFSGTRR